MGRGAKRYYIPKETGQEKRIKHYLDKLQSLIEEGKL